MKQSGNALFLILIAVALFAALSYAVTQSGRGGGSIDRETALLDMAKITQDISQIRQGVERMRLLNGIPLANIKFCVGANTDCFNQTVCTTGTDCVFAPEGGGVDPSFMTGLTGGAYFLHEANGTFSLSGSSANTLFVRRQFTDKDVNFTQSECQLINTSNGLSATLEEEQNSNTVFADGIASLQGEWVFCYDHSDSPSSELYMPFWIIATD